MHDVSRKAGIGGEHRPPPSGTFKAEVRENTPLNPSHYLLTFIPLDEPPEPQPGQFYMIGIAGLRDPLLKRPFAALRTTPQGSQILYRVRGKGTDLMRELRPGSILDIVGPLGAPYPRAQEGQRPLIVAGGVAIASVFSLIESLEKPIILYGARHKDELLMLDELRRLAGELLLSTDDGSFGQQGTVVDLLGGLALDAGTVLYVCGPRAMARAVARTAGEKGLTGYVSLEEHMACGVGACLGCAVKTREGYKMVCADGPVFGLQDIDWEAVP